MTTDANEVFRQFKKAKIQRIEAADYRQIGQRYKFSIIVPYRDNKYQNRKQQLDTFVPYMTDRLTRLETNYDFCIIVVEQSQDGRKFNRGKLLNVGVGIAQEQGCDYHIFHDIDLLPDDTLLDYYGLYPVWPIYLAAVWEKSQHLDIRFGGICSFTTEHFETINGFPNNFWGWGGEDFELYNRVADHDMTILEPIRGRLTELPHISAKSIPELLNEERKELILQRVAKGEGNGLSNLQIKRLDEPERLNHRASKYLVVL